MRRAFLKGNDAVICGALSAGCRAFFGYPITPASEIAHDAMQYFPQAGGIAIQAESETAAINMLYGAAAAGKAAMTATSGPGFSLMQEGISYMAAANLPGVIVDIMRSGPGLGNIGPEQGDYYAAVRGGGHGHYHTPVLAPNSVFEMYDMTRRAFDIAFKYQTPVIVLADAFIGQMMETLNLPDDLPLPAETAEQKWPLQKAVRGDKETFGHIVSTLELVPAKLRRLNDARFELYRRMECDLPECDEDCQNGAETLVTAYGICARTAHDTILKARAQGRRISFFRPKTLWPYPEEALRRAAQGAERIAAVECSRGQMMSDIERILGGNRHFISVCADGGMIPDAEEIAAALK